MYENSRNKGVRYYKDICPYLGGQGCYAYDTRDCDCDFRYDPSYRAIADAQREAEEIEKKVNDLEWAKEDVKHGWNTGKYLAELEHSSEFAEIERYRNEKESLLNLLISRCPGVEKSDLEYMLENSYYSPSDRKDVQKWISAEWYSIVSNEDGEVFLLSSDTKEQLIDDVFETISDGRVLPEGILGIYHDGNQMEWSLTLNIKGE